MSDQTGIQIAALEETDLLSGKRLWRRIDTEVLRQNLRELLEQVESLVPEPASDEDRSFGLAQVEVAITIGAKGQVGILGMGGELNKQASLTLTLQRR